MNNLGIDIEGFKLLPKDLQGWGSTHCIFKELCDKVEPGIIIEVGTWKGASAIEMAKHSDAMIYCVDTWLGAVEFWTRFKETGERDLMLKNGYPSIYNQFLSNVIHEGLQHRIIPIPNTSSAGAEILKHYEVKADLIYIDGSHEYEDVKSDIKNYLPLLNDGGIMFGDDYGWTSVSDAVKESFNYVDIDIVDQNFWIFKK
jgi:predicted O-methyltransferase YrrM